ncbi:MAG: endolytic transglycosylase MltG, partial [Dehalococcoidia bacterium]
MIARLVGLAALAVAVLFGVVAYRASRNVETWALPAVKTVPVQPGTSGNQTATVVINKGENARTIGTKLQSAGVVRSAAWFRMLAEIEGIQNDLAAGSYQFQVDSDTQAVLDRVKVGILEPQTLATIPEGLRIEQVADLLQKRGVFDAQPLLDQMRTGTSDSALLQDRPAGTTLEGYVFPDTYFFPKKTTPDQVLQEMLGALNDRFD